MRSSTNPRQFPGPTHGTSTSYGSTVRADTIGKDLTEPGTGSPVAAADKKVVSGYNAYRSVHAVKGHSELSEPGNILVTYDVWGLARCDPSWDDQECDTAVYPVEYDLYYTAADAGASGYFDGPHNGYQQYGVSALRSLKFPIKYVKPWCTLESPNTMQAHIGT
jgi:hypothetical protein